MKVKAKREVHDHVFDDLDNQGLTPGQVYDVIGVDDEYYRVIDDAAEPILYPKYLFDVVDDAVPEWWVHRGGTGGEYHIDPPELGEPGFYEDYFDGKPEARAVFERFLTAQGLKGRPRDSGT